MTSETRPTKCLAPMGLFLLVLIAPCIHAQSEFKLAGKWDSANAPSSGPIPGLRHSFRQQILIEASRLTALKDKSLTGLRFRRDLGTTRELKGGVIDVTVRLSTTTRTPGQAVPLFDLNAPPASQATVLSGSVMVPTSPKLGASPAPWSVTNSFSISFTKAYTYKSGTLVIDISARPRVDGLPEFWYVDHEFKPGGGQVRMFGSTCSTHTASGKAISVGQNGLVIGGMLDVLLIGQPGAAPMLLVGTSTSSPLELSRIGAPGCFLHINYFAIAGLRYGDMIQDGNVSFASFKTQIPVSSSLLNATVLMQGAESQLNLSRSRWTNFAGLTTSQGVELKLGSQPPSLGMSVVRSDAMERSKPIPNSGWVDVERAPVLRLLYK